MSKSKLVSPNEMLKAARERMLEGREPVTVKDWIIIMNFFAANVHPDTADPVCQLLRLVYEMPITKSDVTKIVKFQLERRAPQ
jgi:hypothetical protein